MTRTRTADEHHTFLVEHLATLEGRFTELVAQLRGAVVNDVLFSGQVVLDGNGVATVDFETPFGSIAVSNHSNSAIVVADGSTQSSAPPNGPGVFTVGASAGETINHAGREFTVYGVAGGVVTLQVFTRPQPPSRGLARAAGSAAAAVAAGSVTSAQVVATGTQALTSLSAAAAPVAGAALSTGLAHRDWTMQVTGTGAGLSVNFEVCLDGVTWVPVTPTVVAGAGGTVVGSAATTNGLYTISVPATNVRARLTAITSGAVSAVIAGA